MASGSAGNTLYGIFYFIFMSVIILGAAYYATRFIAKKGITSMSNKNLKVVETLSLGLDKSLMLVKAGEQYFLLGSTPKGITLLSQLEPEKLSLTNGSELYGNIEGDNIEAYLNELESSRNKTGSSNTIKHNLNKLKSIVRGNKLDG